jgi:hypothetical protein
LVAAADDGRRVDDPSIGDIIQRWLVGLARLVWLVVAWGELIIGRLWEAIIRNARGVANWTVRNPLEGGIGGSRGRIGETGRRFREVGGRSSIFRVLRIGILIDYLAYFETLRVPFAMKSGPLARFSKYGVESRNILTRLRSSRGLVHIRWDRPNHHHHLGDITS